VTLTLVSMLAAGCAGTAPDLRPQEGTSFMSEQEEVRFGYYVDAVVCSRYPLCPDQRLQQAVAEVGQRLVAASARPNLRFTFRVLESSEVNAFSGPGGFVYVTTGLLGFLKSKDELAAVLGHEIGHICARHQVRAWHNADVMRRGLSALDLAAIIAGVPPLAGLGGEAIGKYGQRLAQFVAAIAYQGYSRSFEYQADRLGLRYAGRAGYDPHGFISLFQRLERAEEGKRRGLILLRSHPYTEDRLRQIQQLLEGDGTSAEEGGRSP